MNGLFFAARALLQDLAPTVVFAVLIALKVDPRLATAAAMAIGLAQVLYMRVRRLEIAPLQWASLGLVLVFGMATILTNDARFLMAKPTVIYAIVGVVMLKRGWMLRYLPPHAGGRGEGAMIAFGYVWAGLMFATGAANLITAILFPAYWVAFMAIVPTASKLALFGVQYLTVRHAAMREFKAEAVAEAA